MHSLHQGKGEKRERVSERECVIRPGYEILRRCYLSHVHKTIDENFTQQTLKRGREGHLQNTR